MRVIAPLVFLAALAGCTSWPDVPRLAGSTEPTEWPALLPFDEIAEPVAEDDGLAERDRLLARAEGLRARASLLRQPVPDDDAMERLRRRLAP